jgi:predicted Zn-dependent peptidase
MIGTLLGGSFTSRLNQNLRERNGFTYGAGSRFVLGPWSGHFIASTSVKTEVTGPALKEILRELDRLTASGGGDISDDEIVKARKTLRTDTVQTFEGLGRIVALGAELDRVGLPFESVAGDLAAHEKLSAKDLNAIAGNAIALKRGVLVLVGDKGKILEQIKDLGLPPATEVDALGEPAKR